MTGVQTCALPIYWAAHTNSEATGYISLVPGRYYDLSVEYYEGTGDALVKLFWTEPGGPRQIVPQSQLYPADSGLRAAYFAGTNLANMVLTRFDETVNFSWGDSSPDPALLPGSFSARWVGKLRANQGGTYAFHTLSDDGVRLRVNGQLIINNWTVHPLTENSGNLILTAGQSYDLSLEYFNSGGTATIVLMWTPPGEAKQIIPGTRLTPHQNNTPPMFAALPNFVAVRSNLLAFTASASDAEAPPQLLTDRKSTRLNSSHGKLSRMPSSA